MAISKTDPRDDESNLKDHLSKVPMKMKILSEFLMLGAGDEVQRLPSKAGGRGTIVKITDDNSVHVVWNGKDKVDSANSCRITGYKRVTSLRREHSASRGEMFNSHILYEACRLKRIQLEAAYA